MLDWLKIIHQASVNWWIIFLVFKHERKSFRKKFSSIHFHTNKQILFYLCIENKRSYSPVVLCCVFFVQTFHTKNKKKPELLLITEQQQQQIQERMYVKHFFPQSIYLIFSFFFDQRDKLTTNLGPNIQVSLTLSLFLSYHFDFSYISFDYHHCQSSNEEKKWLSLMILGPINPRKKTSCK